MIIFTAPKSLFLYIFPHLPPYFPLYMCFYLFIPLVIFVSSPSVFFFKLFCIFLSSSYSSFLYVFFFHWLIISSQYLFISVFYRSSHLPPCLSLYLCVHLFISEFSHGPLRLHLDPSSSSGQSKSRSNSRLNKHTRANTNTHAPVVCIHVSPHSPSPRLHDFSEPCDEKQRFTRVIFFLWIPRLVFTLKEYSNNNRKNNRSRNKINNVAIKGMKGLL